MRAHLPLFGRVLAWFPLHGKGSPSPQCTESFPDLCLLALASPPAVGGPRMVRSPALCGRLFLTTSLETSNSQNFTVQMGVFRRLRQTFRLFEAIFASTFSTSGCFPQESPHFVSISGGLRRDSKRRLSQSRHAKTVWLDHFLPVLPAKLMMIAGNRPQLSLCTETSWWIVPDPGALAPLSWVLPVRLIGVGGGRG